MIKLEQVHLLEASLGGQSSTAMDQIKAEPSKLPPLPPDAMIIIPVRYLVLFPGMIVPISDGFRSSHSRISFFSPTS